MSDLVDQYKEQLRQEQAERVEQRRRQEQREWAEKDAEKNYQLYLTNPTYRKEADEIYQKYQQRQADEQKKSISQKLHDELERRQQELEEEQNGTINNADGPYYEEGDHYTH